MTAVYAILEDPNEDPTKARNFLTLTEAIFFRNAATDYVVAIENGKPRQLTSREEEEYSKLVSSPLSKFTC